MDTIQLLKPAARLTPTAGVPEREHPVPAVTAPAPAPHQQVQVSSGQLRASFDYDQSLKQIIIVVTSAEPGEVVKQIPNEKVMRVLSGMMEELGKVLDARG